jgi:MFS family permease
LLVILAFNYVDRLALGLLLEDIKAELHLSDTQLGLLTGIAFAAFYSIMGIPIARWADRGNRVTIIAVTTALWSIAVAACGLAGSFIQLLLIRAGVGVGEAGCVPPANSLIADFFDRAERPRAVSIYMLGSPLSVFIGYFMAGWLNQHYGWRMTFVLLGAPGLLLALLTCFTLREPRKASASVSAPLEASPSFTQVLGTLARNVTFRRLVLFSCIVNFFGLGILQWQPAFFMRSHGVQTAELGLWLAVIYGCGSLIGTYLGGFLASRFGRHDERLQLGAMALAYSICGVLSAGVYLAPSFPLAMGLLGIATLGGSMALGPLYATIQTLVPQHMRAMAVAILFLFSNLIGIGFGPLAAGMLSDGLRPLMADESLRYALLILSPGYLLGAWQLLRARGSVVADLQHVSEGDY